MTLTEAYIEAKMSNKAYEKAYLIMCKDYGNMWGFAFSPIPYSPDDPHTSTGGGYVTVDKKTGKVGGINAINSWGLRGRNVPLKSLDGLIRPVTIAKKKRNRAPTVAVASCSANPI